MCRLNSIFDVFTISKVSVTRRQILRVGLHSQILYNRQNSNQEYMHHEPNWLDIQEQLYPELYVSKILHVQSFTSGAPIHYPIHVTYNSLHREINATEAFQELVEKYYDTEETYNIHIFDPEEQRFKIVGSFPLKEPLILRGIFVQTEFFMIKLEQTSNQANPMKTKPKTDKTLKFVLQKVAQWRKINLDNQKKVTLEQAATIIGISRNTLNDYYFQIKLAQKHGYNFQEHLQQPFQNLRKFVKTQEEKKPKGPDVLPNILSKYQPK